MLHKVWLRITEFRRRSEASNSIAWCRKNAQSLEDFACGLDSELWDEAVEFSERLRAEAVEKLKSIGMDLGGGGDYRLLYFLSRHLNPNVVVETGVAAGYSTQAILSALHTNNKGRLYSSDFPYFRLDQPSRFVGFLVAEELKDRWELYDKGDRINLPIICRSVDTIGLLHYDSDKSRAGREYALRTMESRLNAGSVAIMDDIQDNLFFCDYVDRYECDYRVFEFENKFLGLIYF